MDSLWNVVSAGCVAYVVCDVVRVGVRWLAVRLG